jgi:hypothetical protein
LFYPFLKCFITCCTNGVIEGVADDIVEEVWGYVNTTKKLYSEDGDTSEITGSIVDQMVQETHKRRSSCYHLPNHCVGFLKCERAARK